MRQLHFTLATALSLAFAPFLLAQTPASAPPHIRWGLWRENVTTTISGIDGIAPISQKITEQFCITPGSFRRYGLQAANPASCSISNRREGRTNISYDATCGRSPQALMTFHMNIRIDSDRQMHGTAVATITAPGSSRHGTWTSSVTEHYLASGCGSLKPGDKTPVK